jgi:hypothetical protein
MRHGWVTLAAGLAVTVAAVLAGPPGEAADDIAWSVPGTDGWVRGPFVDARVTSVRLASRVEQGTTGVSTSRVFVVVGVEVAGHREFAPLSRFALHTADGYSYAQRGDLPRAQPSGVEPGFTSVGSVLFELPPERVAGADLELVPHAGGLLVFRSGVRFPDVVPAGTSLEHSVVLDLATTEVTR